MKTKSILNFMVCAVLLSACTKSGSSSNLSSSQEIANKEVQTSASGGVDGGGGKGILCGSKVVTLDLYEARKNGLHPAESSGSLDSDLKKFGTELGKHFTASLKIFDDPKFEDIILKELNNHIISHFKDIPQGKRLPLTNDATIPALPEGCSVVQIAIYSKDGTIYRDAEYWSQLDVIEQAALIHHEWVYYRARQYGAMNSDESRKILGLIFSGKNPEPLLSPLWKANRKIWCGAGIQGTARELYEIYGVDEIRNGQSGVGLYFAAFKSVYLTSRVSTFLPGVNLGQVMLGKFPATSVIAKNNLLNKTWTFEFSPEDQHSGDIQNTRYILRAYSNGQTPPPYSTGFCKLE